MSSLSMEEVGPLIVALDDPSAAVRLAALRALVRLALSREAWLEVSRRVARLLQATPEGESFRGQTLEGIPYSEVLEAAVRVPTRPVRRHLHGLLAADDDDVRTAAARALATDRDPAAIPHLVSTLSDPDVERRIEAAKDLSLLDAPSMRDSVSEAFYRIDAHDDAHGDVRFWLALALARLGEPSEIDRVLRELRQGALELRESYGDPMQLAEQLRKRGPFPETTRDLLLKTSEEKDDFAAGIAMELYRAGRQRAVDASLESPSPDALDPELEKLAEAIVKVYQKSGSLDQEHAEKAFRPDILAYLPPELSSRLATDLFKDAIDRGEFGTPGNDIVTGIHAARSTFVPDLHGLFECYSVVREDEASETQWFLPWSLRWQIAWAVSRAGQDRFLPAMSSRLTSSDERERAAAARLIEEATLYVHQDHPPIFGGGSAPSDLFPQTKELFDDDEAHPGTAVPMAPTKSADDDEDDDVDGAADDAAYDDEDDDLHDRPRSHDRDIGESKSVFDEKAGEPQMPPPMRPPNGVADKQVPRNGGGGNGGAVVEVHSKQPRRQKRVVNTGFTPLTLPDEEIDAAMPLKAGGQYYFWLEIGKPRAKSIESTPTDIPSVPVDARLTVAVFGFKDGIKVRRGADIGELEAKGDGTVRVIRQPLAESFPKSRYLSRRLFFPVRTPRKAGTFRMRCNIYFGQVLLQSRVVHARVMMRPRRIKRQKALRSVLDYTLSRQLSPSHLTRLSEHRLSVLLNNNGDGTHSFHFFGADGGLRFKQDDVRFREGELDDMITQARETLRIASWGDKDEWREGIAYRYKDRLRNVARLKGDLTNLAKWGYEFYAGVSGRMAGGEDAVADFEKLLMKPGTLQIAMKESPSYLLPAAMIYDYPLDTGAENYSFCPSFEAALNRGAPLEDVECFQGNCPTRKNDTVICPSGFWGFRHSLGMPLSIKGAPDVPSQIAVRQDLTVAVSVATDLQLLGEHAKVLQHLRPGMVWNYADTRDEVFSILKESPHVVYFYCHGGLSRNAPYLQVGPKEHPGLILRSNFYAKEIVWDAPRPLVFINGCHTTAVKPLQALDFVSALVTHCRSSGVIGTEITIFEELATVFAEECLTRFCGDESIGEAIRNARLKLLSEGNPLGLVYIPFVMAGLSLDYESAESRLGMMPPPAEPGGGIDQKDDVVIVKNVAVRRQRSR